MPALFWVILLLIGSNTFMTIAWYEHLRDKHANLVWTIATCWLIALPEYILQVPANRIGNYTLSATQLKVIQEVISLSVFVAFAWWRLGEVPTWRTAVAFVLIALAVAVVRGGNGPAPAPAEAPKIEQNDAPAAANAPAEPAGKQAGN
ncbi:MAG: DMT family protein [Gemmataceae bacterium]